MPSAHTTGTDGIVGRPAAAVDGVQACEFGKCILHLFGGPKRRVDGFAAALESLGWRCEEYDLVNGEDQDLTADHVWLEVRQKLKQGRYGSIGWTSLQYIHQRSEAG